MYPSSYKTFLTQKVENFTLTHIVREKIIFKLTLRSLVCEIKKLLMNSCGSLANPRKNSRCVFNMLIFSTVSWICRQKTLLNHEGKFDPIIKCVGFKAISGKYVTSLYVIFYVSILYLIIIFFMWKHIC